MPAHADLRVHRVRQQTWQTLNQHQHHSPPTLVLCCPAACHGQVADPGSVTPRTLYGVCCYVRELVHRPPSMAREVSGHWCASCAGT